ncbi:hypothetical protein RHSIM_Rhsim02G0248600 [Rhododendron simsii]|uniref:Glycine-rich protein n=1 Tax=Rhododendron simsii TaxID=118357 RepID=A0A834LVJ4_RHOSS|nr:hypothetical protein RHSIM_Rhsim02G0248600 [Rhododendron simsii]
MGQWIKAFVYALLLIFMFTAMVEGLRYPVDPVNKLNEKNMRELIMGEAMSDYEKPGPNRGHDPGKGP